MTLSGLIESVYRKLIRPIIYIEKFCYLHGLLSTIHLTLPDFLCIGVEKAGTTWLHENLKQHPEIFMSAKKELNYFRRDYWFYSFPLTYYASHFKNAPSSTLKGESTPYCTMPSSKIRFLHSIMPRLKLIIILRNPVERLWSHGLMHFIGSQKRNFEDIKHDEFIELLSRKEILEFGFYPAMLEKWNSIFPKNQLKVLFYDDLANDPKRLLDECFNFLNVSPVESYEKFYLDKFIFKGPQHPIPKEIRDHFSEVYKSSILELSKEFGEKVEPWISR